MPVTDTSIISSDIQCVLGENNMAISFRLNAFLQPQQSQLQKACLVTTTHLFTDMWLMSYQQWWEDIKTEQAQQFPHT